MDTYGISAYGILVSGLLLLYLSGRAIPRLPVLAYLMLLLLCLAFQWWPVPLPFANFIGTGLLAVVLNLLPSALTTVQSLLSVAPLR